MTRPHINITRKQQRDRKKQVVFDALAQRQPLTSHELAVVLGMSPLLTAKFLFTISRSGEISNIRKKPLAHWYLTGSKQHVDAQSALDDQLDLMERLLRGPRARGGPDRDYYIHRWVHASDARRLRVRGPRWVFDLARSA